MRGGPELRAQYLEALGIDRYVSRQSSAPAAAIATAAAPMIPVAPRTSAAAPDSVPARTASPAASDPRWEPLAAEVRACTKCGLHASRTQTVFGVGDRHAELLVVGEAPGADEDLQGEPFVGRAGQLLNSMLRAMRAPRETVYIANVLKCRPPGNRDPAPEEVRCCLPYLQRQIELIAPRLMLAVGRIAAQNLLATDTPIGKLRGAVHRFGTQGTPLIVTYHPAYLLRSPGQKRQSWIDLRFVQRELARLRATARAVEG
jgi:DNA polymerase